MRQVVLSMPKTFEFHDVEIPKPQRNQALIKVRAVGICGSDIHAYYGEHPFIKCPIVLGHEATGDIVELGADVKNLKVGDRVILRPQVICKKCHMCKTNRYNICKELQVLGCQLPGAYVDYYVVDAELLYKLPDELEYDVATIIEPLAVGVHAVKCCGDITGKNAVVIGAGPIGNVVAQSAKSLGAKAVLIADVSQYKLDMAKKCGIDHIVNVRNEDIKTATVDYFGEDGVDIVFECSANEDALNLALDYTRKGADIVIVGVFSNKSTVNMANVQDREYRLSGSLMYVHEDYLDAIRLVADKKVNLKTLISNKFSLDQVADAYKYIENNRDTVQKVILEV